MALEKPTEMTVTASHFCGTLHVNVDNAKLSDADFREFVRNTLPIVIYPRPTLHTEPNENVSGTSSQ